MLYFGEPVAVLDPDLEIRGGGSSRPLDKGGGPGLPPKFSKIGWGGGKATLWFSLSNICMENRDGMASNCEAYDGLSVT